MSPFNVFEQETSLFDKCFITFFLLHNVRFFNFKTYVELGTAFIPYIDIFFCICFLYFLLFRRPAIGQYNTIWKSVTILFTIFLISIPNAFLQSGQSLYMGFRGIINTYMALGFFYYLADRRISPDFIIKIFKTFAIAYVLLIIISNITYPNVYFGFRGGDWDEVMLEKLDRSIDQRGVYRFSIPGADYLTLVLLYYIALSENIKSKLPILMLLALFILMRGTRGPIVWTILTAIITYMLSNGNKTKGIVVTAISCIVVYVALINIPFTSEIINSLVEHTNQEFNDYGNENARLLSLEYFTLQFNEGQLFPILFGNGIPIEGVYHDKIARAQSLGMYTEDIEYVRFFVFFGIVGLIALVYFVRSILKSSVDSSCLFLKMFIVYIMLQITMGAAIFNQLSLIAMISYLLYYNSLIVQDQNVYFYE